MTLAKQSRKVGPTKVANTCSCTNSQLDGAPAVASGAFAYETGREPWAAPSARPYTINVDLTEPNGGSDLTDVFVELASNQGSDTLPIQWDFSTGNCTTTSPHLDHH